MEIEEAKMAKLEIAGSPQRNFVRSEARNRYSSTGSRHAYRYGHQHKKPGKSTADKSLRGYKERIVFQAIICGGFLAVVLFFNIVDSAPTNAVTAWIDRNISYNMLTEEEGIGAWMDSVISFFGGDRAYEDVRQDINPIEYHDAFNPAELSVPADAGTTDSSRIDENILREIEEAVDIYYENNR